MSLSNKCQFIGNLTADPAGRSISIGGESKRVLNFTLGINDRSEKDKDNAVFVDFEAWEKQAETLEKLCSKGDRVAVEGKYKVENWIDEKSGQKRYRSKFRLLAFELLKVKKWSEADASAPEGETEAKPKAKTKPGKKSQPEPEYEDVDVEDTDSEDEELPF